MIRDLRLFGLVALIACLGPLGLPSAADAQQSAPPRRIGVLLVGLSPESKEAQAFRQTLRDAEYAEARDVVIEWRFANGDYSQIPQLAADLVERKVDVIVVDGTPAAQVVKRATSTIPIVMATVADPIPRLRHLDVLRAGHEGSDAPRGWLRRPHFERGEAVQLAHRAGIELRVRHRSTRSARTGNQSTAGTVAAGG